MDDGETVTLALDFEVVSEPLEPITATLGFHAASHVYDPAPENNSAEVTTTVPPPPAANAPGAPRNLGATPNGQTQVDLSWSPPSSDGGQRSPATGVQVSADRGNWRNLSANTRSTATSYSHTNLAAGSTRHYRVAAINAAGAGP